MNLNIIQNIASEEKVILFPYGEMAKKIEPFIRAKNRNILIVDNVKEDCTRLRDVTNPNTYKWIIAVERIELYLELSNDVRMLGVEEKNIIDPHREVHDINKYIHVDKCPICGSPRYLKLSHGVLRCEDCTHGYREYIPNEILRKYYDKKYWADDKNRQGILEVKEGKEWSKWVSGRIKELEKFGLLNDELHSILEFGCSEGMLLYELKKRGYDVMGNDICVISEESKRNLGIDISNLPIERFSKLNYSFDLIMSFHVIEHLHNPLSVMKNLGKMLNHGGKMLMHIPIDDIELSNTDHFHFFTEQSAIRLMEQIVNEVMVDKGYYNISSTEIAVAGTFVGIKR